MTSVGASSSLETNAAVVQVPASGSWDGNDGPWSTFDIYVGTPAQPARVLVSTRVGETWVVSANRSQGGCFFAGSPSNCPELRGGLFDVNASSTWHDKGIYTLDYVLGLPDYDGWNNVGDFGFDTLGLVLPDSTGVKFKSQTIAAYASQYYYLGLLGVIADASIFNSTSESSTPEMSFLSSLKESGSTPSLTFAYSAGARYRGNSTATLTLGGYDSSRFTWTNGFSFSFAQSSDDPLIVGLQAITMNNAANTSLLPNGILALIDSSVPHLWLPREACRLFESAFGIVYNDTVNRYLVNETLHRRLQSENPSVSFFLGSNTTGGSTVNITLPYGSFDLELGTPYVNDTENYFPLRRADNDTQYTLGRTFLQEAYLIVDYERQNFSVHQNVWNPNTVPQIVSIPAVNATTNTNDMYYMTPDRRPLTSEIAGLVVSILAFCSIFLGLALEFRVKQRARKKLKGKAHGPAEFSDAYSGKPEMDANGKARGELHSAEARIEADSRSRMEVPAGQLSELEGDTGVSELRVIKNSAEKDQ